MQRYVQIVDSVENVLKKSFKLFRDKGSLPISCVVWSRQSLTVLLPVPETLYLNLPTKETVTSKVTPVFFNIGINEYATLLEILGYTRKQHRSNCNNFVRLKQYHIRFKKLNLTVPDAPSKAEALVSSQTLRDLLLAMEDSFRTNASNNVKIHLAEDICRGVHGICLTSYKSVKDRTAMAATQNNFAFCKKIFIYTLIIYKLCWTKWERRQ